MIKNISLFTKLKTSTLKHIKNLTKPSDAVMPKMQTPKKDVFELSSKDGLPEVLFQTPPIYEYRFNSGIKDYRLSHFVTEYRAYNYEGYDTKFPSKYVCIDANGDRRLKPHIYLSYVEVSPEYTKQGVYKNVIKQLAKRAKLEEDCEGRIVLEARNMSNYVETQNPYPSLAHWKCGFRFVNEENNKTMQKVLKGELSLDNAPEGTMYYAFI